MHNKLSLLHLNGIHESPHTANVKAQKNWWGPFLPDFWATTSSSPRELYPLRGHSPTWWRAQPLEQSFPMSWQLQTQVQEAWVCLQWAGQMYHFPKGRLTNPCQAQQMAMMVKWRAKLREKKCIFPSNKYVLTVGLRENSAKHLFTL